VNGLRGTGMSAIRRATWIAVLAGVAVCNAGCGVAEKVGGSSLSTTNYQFRWGPLAIDRTRDTSLWKCPEGTVDPSPEKCAPGYGGQIERKPQQ